MKPVLALDSSPQELEVYKKNFPSANTLLSDVSDVLDSPLRTPASRQERKFLNSIGEVELAIAGPPCQGHSDLNNHSRRVDPKNRLYERVARFAELVRPEHIIIENVPAVLHDRKKVVHITVDALSQLGYDVDYGIVEMSTLGIAQQRRRHVLVASLTQRMGLKKGLVRYVRRAPGMAWAVSDLGNHDESRPFDTAASARKFNQKRIEYLFKMECYNLPDSQRPDCHRLKDHSYKSVYGRMYWDRPAQTITSGFGCMGQGRFVHPKQKRTITPHEAARLQFIPDFFRFDWVCSRTALARMIANAVPPKLSYVLALELLR